MTPNHTCKGRASAVIMSSRVSRRAPLNENVGRRYLN